MKNTLKAAIERKLEAHRLSRRLKKVRNINRTTGSPWLDGFAQAILAGLHEDEALQNLNNRHQEQKTSHELH